MKRTEVNIIADGFWQVSNSNVRINSQDDKELFNAIVSETARRLAAITPMTSESAFLKASGYFENVAAIQLTDKPFYITAETRDGEHEYLQRGVVRAKDTDEAYEKAYRLFDYNVCNDSCEPDCIWHGENSSEYRITTLKEAREISESDFAVLSKYL